MTKVQADLREGIGLRRPATSDRNPDHADPQWLERGLDEDDYKQTDDPDIDPLPTERHRTIPS